MEMTQNMAELMKIPRVLPYPEHLEDTRRIAAESMVLLKNTDNVLPLKSDKLALFGAGAADTVSCGTGSGYVAAPHVVTVEEGIRAGGIQITSGKWLERFAEASRKANEEDTFLTPIDRIWSGKKILIDEIPITDEDIEKAAEAETAVYVIRRNAGEEDDRKEEKGDYYLSDTEEENLKKVAAGFDHTIVVFNTCVMDAGFIDRIPGIDGAVLMGLTGNECGNALTDLLTGKCNPCGKLAATWAKSYSDYPASAVFGRNDGNAFQEDYQEDIYVGYRYFDSFGKEPLFPFGYGLSYTDFDIKHGELKADWTSVSLQAEVTNCGNLPGREIVQLYVTAPEGRLGKPLQELKAYAKTRLLEPGEREVLTLCLNTESLASYDEEKAAFVMEQGDYILRLGRDSRHSQAAAVIRIEGEALLRQVRNEVVPDHELDLIAAPTRRELYQMLAEDSLLISLLDECFTERTPDVILNAAECSTIDGVCRTKESDMVNKHRFEQVKPAYNAILSDVKEGKVSMDEFVASLEPEVLLRLVTGAANETPYDTEYRTDLSVEPIEGPRSSGATTSRFISSLGIPNWKMTDGPAGCHLPMNGATCYPTGMAMAQTWDPELGNLMGHGIGKELTYYNHGVILGPGMNIQRDPLCGRNFEYFSEDPLLSGKTAAAVTKGVQSVPGAAVSIKHFACNNQEAERYTSNSTVSERALREIYLRGFEICVREAKPRTVMTAYNKLNGIHCSSHYALLTEVLRGEWGFEGMIMTDWGTRSEKTADYHAGNDLVMGGYWTDVLLAALEGKKAALADDGYVVTHEFPVYGGFITETIEEWNTFLPYAGGPDEISVTVKAKSELNPKAIEKIKKNEAKEEVLQDGSRKITYCGKDRGQYLALEDIQACAANVLTQIMESVSYMRMEEQIRGKVDEKN